MATEHKDLPYDEIIKMAEGVIQKTGPGTTVHFKFTCRHCGERCTFDTPNTIYHSGECVSCGRVQEIRLYGFDVRFEL